MLIIFFSREESSMASSFACAVQTLSENHLIEGNNKKIGKLGKQYRIHICPARVALLEIFTLQRIESQKKQYMLGTVNRNYVAPTNAGGGQGKKPPTIKRLPTRIRRDDNGKGSKTPSKGANEQGSKTSTKS
jgi:hypothetical protein